MAKDQKIKELNEKIDWLHLHFAKKLIEKEKEIYHKFVEYFTKLGHDMHLFTQSAPNPANAADSKKTKTITNKKSSTKKASSKKAINEPIFLDYFKVAPHELDKDSVLLSEPEKLVPRPKSRTNTSKNNTSKKATTASSKKVTPKKAESKPAASKKPRVKSTAVKKTPAKTAIAKKATPKKAPATKIVAQKTAPKKSAPTRSAVKKTTAKQTSTDKKVTKK